MIQGGIFLFQEEVIGLDCITQGKYGYIDPTGEVREYTYSSGIRCDPDTRQVSTYNKSFVFNVFDILVKNKKKMISNQKLF